MIGPFPLIVSDTVKSNANNTWALIDRDTGGYATFSVALSPSGSPNPTHWACSTWLEPVCVDALQPGVSNAGFSAFLQARAAELGRPMPNNPGQFRAQFKMGQQGEDFWSFIAAQGLQVIQEPTIKK